MAEFKVLVTDYAWPSLDIETEILQQVDAELVAARTGEEDEFISLAIDVDAILTCWKPVTSPVLDAAERCKVVSRYGIGLDNIAVDQATALGMIVTNVPDFCLDEVADHVMALLLACARRVAQFDRATSQGVWNLKAESNIPRLRGQTLGLLGFGNTARALVPRANGFGLKVLAYTPRLAAEGSTANIPEGVEIATSLDALLQQSDYISIHVPLTDATRALIDSTALGQMKSSAYLINTSRGAVIDDDALLAALRDRRIAGAAIDVTNPEPPEPTHPLLVLDNVVATPHAAFFSQTAIKELQEKAARNVVRVLQGEVPQHTVNREVLERPNCRFVAS